MARSWDPAGYHRVSGPMETMGRAVLDRLDLRGDETVLDAGCGTGRITALLAERLPRGRVIAVDADADMVAAARRNLGPRADVRLADLTELDLGERVDAVVSTATFHWVLDRDRMFARLFEVLRPGGTLVAQCGGRGNIAGVLAAAAEVAAEPDLAGYFAGWTRPSRMVDPDEAQAELARAGFVDVRCWLEPAPVVPEDPDAYLATISLGAHLDRLPPQLRDAFVRRVADRLGTPITIDYIRCNLDARRPEAGAEPRGARARRQG